MELFEIKDNILMVNKEHLLTIASFRKLYYRDRDPKKQGVLKECMYIYHVCNPNSVPNKQGYNPKEAHAYAIHNAELDSKWLPTDETLQEAMDDYYGAVQHPGITPIIELKKTFTVINKLVIKIREELNTKLDTIRNNKTPMTDVEIKAAMGLTKELLGISTDIPSHIESLSKAEALLRKQNEDVDDVEERQGGGEIYDSMNPDKAIG